MERKTFAQTDMQVDKRGGRERDRQAAKNGEESQRQRGAEKRGEEKQRDKKGKTETEGQGKWRKHTKTKG
jgi:hypothetical protein